jgi:hypothetical protein
VGFVGVTPKDSFVTITKEPRTEALPSQRVEMAITETESVNSSSKEAASHLPVIPTPAPVVRLKSRDISTSVASRALRKSYKLFKDSVDPDSLVAVLYSNMLLTPDERERATQKTETANQRLQVILMALERRIFFLVALRH